MNDATGFGLVVSGGFPTNKSSELKIVSGNPDASSIYIVTMPDSPIIGAYKKEQRFIDVTEKL